MMAISIVGISADTKTKEIAMHKNTEIYHTAQFRSHYHIYHVAYYIVLRGVISLGEGGDFDHLRHQKKERGWVERRHRPWERR